jgi:hypothetical protein
MKGLEGRRARKGSSERKINKVKRFTEKLVSSLGIALERNEKIPKNV